MRNQGTGKLRSIDPYDIRIGYDLLHSLPDYVMTLVPQCEKYVLVTDENLFKLYGNKIIHSFKEKAIDLLCYTAPIGERSKSREVKAKIEVFMFDNSCHIDTVVRTFGGGVVGDLASFVVATYMRGISYIQIPTSFVSRIDSSIDGKPGVNIEKYGKNQLGSFHRPKAVLIDIRFLETSSTRDFCNGMTEAIKIALIADEPLFIFIKTNISQILDKDAEIMMKLIHDCIKLKANVVIQDENETSGLRSILNFGHSLEILASRKLLHGNKGFLLNSNAVISRLNNVLKCFRLPTTLPSDISFGETDEKMSIDKKNRHGKIQIVILTNIGSVKATPRYTTPIDDQDLINLLDSNVQLIVNTSSTKVTTVNVPGSKSISNRVLLLCALGVDECGIHGLLYSIDTQIMLIYLRQLDVQYNWDKNETLVVHGTDGELNVTGSATLYLNNSGTCSRFLTALCIILLAGAEIVLTENERLKERPIQDLVDTLLQNENNIEYLNEHGCLPIKIRSNGQFKGGEMIINGDVSSQYVTSLLLLSLFASKSIVLKLNQAKPIVSKPYIDITVALMKTQFSVLIDDGESFSYRIPNSEAYRNPFNTQIEGDASSASYMLGMATVHPRLTVTVTNLGSESSQGDSQFYRILEMMGCHVTQTETTTIFIGSKQLQAIPNEIDINTMTNTFITLACVAVFVHDRTQIRNIANQRLKECNTIKAMLIELQKFGITASETETGLDIEGNNNTSTAQSAMIHRYDDHRIAMSFL